MTKPLRNLKVEYREVASLKPYAGNPRTHSPKQVRQIADSIGQFGFTLPILVDARQRGACWACSPPGCATTRSRARADHLPGLLERAAEASVPNRRQQARRERWLESRLLALELQYLSELEIDFDLTITGFETAEIDLMIQGPDSSGSADDADEISEISESSPPVSRLGDLWLLD